MPRRRRRALTEAQLETMLALPADETQLRCYWTLKAQCDREAVQNGHGFTNCIFRQ